MGRRRKVEVEAENEELTDAEDGDLIAQLDQIIAGAQGEGPKDRLIEKTVLAIKSGRLSREAAAKMHKINKQTLLNWIASWAIDTYKPVVRRGPRRRAS